ncbi:MAG: hypothetical protein K0B02_02250 [DPANN group archaeon]|nr:hypothetical protein [DPANN group archaeon]
MIYDFKSKSLIKIIQIVILLLISSLLIVPVSAATIKGTIYDWTTLTPQKNVVLEIDSIPKQLIVLPDGKYDIELPNDNYTLYARYYENNNIESETSEIISITKDGIFIIDLILMPTIENIDTLNNIDLIIDDYFEETENTYNKYILYLIIISASIIIYYRYQTLKNKISKTNTPKTQDSELNKIISLIKNNNNRITQKELRKHMPFSEAKVSLMLDDLENQKIIRKIKKGRANIIILQDQTG